MSLRRRLAEPRGPSPVALASLLFTSLALGACGGSDGPSVDPNTSLYALVETIDGTAFYPPLGPAPTLTGTPDASLLGSLNVVLESTSTAGDVRTVAIFTQRSSPALYYLRDFGVYFVDVPAATYFTEPTSSYRFRLLLGTRELGFSDLSSEVFRILAAYPSLRVGVKVRIESRPVAIIDSISPSSLPRNSEAFTLTVTGRRFVRDSIVRFAGRDYETRRDASGALLIDIPASMLTTPTNYDVQVFTPTPGGGVSGAVRFSVFDPPPAITSVAPTTFRSGSVAQSITVLGDLFTDASSVRIDGAALATDYVSSRELRATIAASSLELGGTRTITVMNPPANSSSGVTITVENPAPTLSSISPTSAVAEGNAFTLTVIGSDFSRQASIRIDGAALATTWITSTQLRATIAADRITTPGTRAITVSSPSPGGGESTAATLSVTSPVPTLTSLSPTSIVAGTNSFVLTLDGSSFLSGAVASWDGTALATTYVSRSRLTAVVPASLVAAAGTASVNVENPQPFEEASGSIGFVIQNPAPVITELMPANAMINQPQIFLTVVGSSFTTGAQITYAGTAVPTTFVSDTRLTTVVPGTLLRGGNQTVSVSNPQPSAGSASATMRVSYPTPTITSLSVTSVPVGSPAFVLTIEGGPFYNLPYTIMNDRELVYRTWISESRVIVTVPWDHLNVAGDFEFIMRNPLPTPAYTTPIIFHVTPASCSDLVQNGDETGVDCGGTACGVCFDQGCVEGDLTCSQENVALASLGGVASASDTTGGVTPAIVNDDAFGTNLRGWGNAGQRDTRLMVRLARPYDVYGVGLYWGGNNSGWNQNTNRNLPTQLQVQYSNDPAALASDPVTSSRWTPLNEVDHLLGASTGTVAGATIIPGFTNGSWDALQAINFNRTEATAIRVVFDGNPAANGGTNSVGLVGELQVFGAVLADGSACTRASSCDSGVCTNGLCDVPTCTDGVMNGDESDVDCGGACGACAVGARCTIGADCAELVCSGWICAAPTCTDGQHNGVETDVDCGNGCAGCAGGDACSVGTDCASTICDNGTCTTPSCFDGVENGSESDVDCGGSCALRCADFLSCNRNLDCASQLCVGGTCHVPIAVLDTITPSRVTVGGAGFSMTLTGDAFTANAVVHVGGQLVSATFLASETMVAYVPASVITAAGTLDVTVSNPGSESVATRTLTVEHPVPLVASFAPTVVAAGDAAFTLTITGSGFFAGATASLGGATLGTTFVSSTVLEAFVPSALVVTGGYYNLSVINAAPNAGASTSRTFTVNNVTPVIASLSPATLPAQSAGFTLTINGAGFGSGAAATFDGATLPTTFLSSTRLTATVPASALVIAGVVPVSVTNPEPSGGAGEPIGFTVAAASCTDRVLNGPETALDCGGGCPGCTTGQVCSAGTDCASQVCTGGVCQAPLCTDGLQNGGESAIDCGGLSCSPCGNGATCNGGADCLSRVCSAGVCQVDSCTDGVQNGAETGVDCGGTCGPCVIRACDASNAASCASCLTILEAGLSQGNAVYEIDPDGAGPNAPYATACDMTTDGGGWSLAAKLSASAMGAAATDPRTAMFAGNLGVGDTQLMNRDAQTRHYSTPLVTTDWSRFAEARWEVLTGGQVQAYLVFDTAGATPSASFARSRLKASSWYDVWEEAQNYFSVDGDTTTRRHFFINRNYGGCGSDAGWLSVTRGGTTCSWEAGARNYAILYARPTTYRTNSDTANYLVANALGVWVRERAPVTAARASCLEILEAGGSTGNGIYEIDPKRNGQRLAVFCDMTTAGGGWTMVYKHSAGAPIPSATTTFINTNYLSGNFNEADRTLLDRGRDSVDYSNRLILEHWGTFAEGRVEVATANTVNAFIKFNLNGAGPLSFFARTRVTDSTWNDLTTETQNFWSPRGDEGIRRHWFVNRNYSGCSVDAGWLAIIQGTSCGWETSRPNSILYANASTYQNYTSGTVATADALVLMVRERRPTTMTSLAPATCRGWLTAGFTTSGLYDVDPTQSGTNVQVYCDMTTDGGGWALAYKHSSGVSRDLGADIASASLNATNTALMTRNRDTSDFASTVLSPYRFAAFSEARFEVVAGGTVRHYLVHSTAGQTPRGVMARGTLLRTSWTDITSNTQNFFSIDGDTSCRRRSFVNRNYSGCATDAGWLVALQGTGCGCGWETANADQIMYAVPNTYQNWTSGSVARADALVMWLR
ncbi:hypothetical protein L6R52_02620 [Myxococcota bacterium]|nr:hypothetical protein [Myxococcota bacterium]